MNLELVIFDMDGLMFNTEQLYFKSWSRALSEKGFSPSEELYKSTMGLKYHIGLATHQKYYGPSADMQSIWDNTDEYMLQLFDEGELKIQKGLMELLDYLEKAQIKKAVASSSPLKDIYRNLSKTNIDHNRFDQLVSGHDLKEAKPNPEIFLKTCRQAGVSTENALVLEDSRNGVKAAYAAKIKCIMIPDLIEPDEELKSMSIVLPSLLDVIGFIENKGNKL